MIGIRIHGRGGQGGVTFAHILSMAATFEGKFGHIFYKDKFSHYILRVEYRFVGDQTPGGPGWAFRNSGIMIHSQSPESMTRGQRFPVSVEVQLLGGNGRDERSTGNVCTPGTHIVMDGELVTRHCIRSRSKTYHGDQWVTMEVEVHGNSIIKHIVKIASHICLSFRIVKHPLLVIQCFRTWCICSSRRR